MIANAPVVRVDPTNKEEQTQIGQVLLARMPSLNHVTQLLMDGELSQQTVEEVCSFSCLFHADVLYL